MKWIYNLKTAVKLVSAFVIIAIILCVVGIYGVGNLGKMDKTIGDMYENRLTPIADLNTAHQYLIENRVYIRDINTTAKTAAKKNEFKEMINSNLQKVEELLVKYNKPGLREKETEILKDYEAAWLTYEAGLETAIKLNDTGISPTDYTDHLLTGGLQDATEKVVGMMGDLITINLERADEANADASELYQSTRNITIIIVIIASIASIGFGVFISQIIARPLRRVVELVGKVADGDLSETSDINTKDETGVLASSVNNMILTLRKTIGGILVSAESVSAAAQQISASTEEVASGSVSQANASHTMSELFRELSVAINSVAQGAEQASELSDTAMRIAEDGGRVVNSSIQGMTRVSDQMSHLEEDSQKIGEIIDVIDEIAEQTNLLALNAAIEAARAGDQGRGFAVVADEVRKLAERSSEATKQITTIIKGMQNNTHESVSAVEEGVASSQKTGEALEQIMRVVNETAEKVMEIAAASEEQAAQSAEVLQSIDSISAATEESAASSEETASTAQSLAHLAEELNNSVSLFRIK
ncbi:MAG TPA: methyl-accepting chemotaxis protein [Candidatus Paenibacillus intestinavium]|nr:methyl-accepting chemotaxis protein [Candidatus Paenibacillus intestinavium]